MKKLFLPGFFFFLFATASAQTDCKSCLYFPLCNYDVTKSFQGIVWKGIRYDDNTIEYYYCNNGVLQKKVEQFDSRDESSLGFETVTILKYNEPKGTVWKEQKDITVTRNFYTHAIADKALTITIDGNIYKDVIKVYSKKMTSFIMLGDIFTSNEALYKDKYSEPTLQASEYLYYAKGAGLVKTEETAEQFVEKKAPEKAKETVVKEEKQLIDEGYAKIATSFSHTHEKKVAGLKGQIDPGLTGLWKQVYPVPAFFIQYHANGTGEIIHQSANGNPLLNKERLSIFHWKTHGNTIETIMTLSFIESLHFKPQELSETEKYNIESGTIYKVNHPVSKYRMLVLSDKFMYIPVDNNTAWPASELSKNVPQGLIDILKTVK